MSATARVAATAAASVHAARAVPSESRSVTTTIVRRLIALSSLVSTVRGIKGYFDGEPAHGPIVRRYCFISTRVRAILAALSVDRDEPACGRRHGVRGQRPPRALAGARGRFTLARATSCASTSEDRGDNEGFCTSHSPHLPGASTSPPSFRNSSFALGRPPAVGDRCAPDILHGFANLREQRLCHRDDPPGRDDQPPGARKCRSAVLSPATWSGITPGTRPSERP